MWKVDLVVKKGLGERRRKRTRRTEKKLICATVREEEEGRTKGAVLECHFGSQLRPMVSNERIKKKKIS